MADSLDIDVDQYKLYKTDWLQEPTTLLKNEEQTLTKAQIKAGDLLVLKTLDYTVASEQITIHLYVTETGIPGEDRPSQDLTVPFDLHLGEFRTRIFSLALLPAASAECIQLRERTKTGHYGRLYREEAKSLKNLHISYNSEIVVQALASPPPYSQGLSLFLCIRDSISKTTTRPKECLFEGRPSPTIDDMYSFVIASLGLEWNINDVMLAKYVPHQFSWEVIEDDRETASRGNLLGNPPTKASGGIYNLKKSPVNLKEGDMLVIRKVSESQEDDFYCEGDKARREAFMASKPGGKSNRSAKKEKSVQILAK